MPRRLVLGGLLLSLHLHAWKVAWPDSRGPDVRIWPKNSIIWIADPPLAWSSKSRCIWVKCGPAPVSAKWQRKRWVLRIRLSSAGLPPTMLSPSGISSDTKRPSAAWQLAVQVSHVSSKTMTEATGPWTTLPPFSLLSRGLWLTLGHLVKT